MVLDLVRLAKKMLGLVITPKNNLGHKEISARAPDSSPFFPIKHERLNHQNRPLAGLLMLVPETDFVYSNTMQSADQSSSGATSLCRPIRSDKMACLAFQTQFPLRALRNTFEFSSSARTAGNANFDMGTSTLLAYVNIA